MANFKIKTTIEVDEITPMLKLLIEESGQVQRELDRNAVSIAAFITDSIIEKIRTDHPIGDFMADRTNINFEGTARAMEFLIRGVPESEVSGGKPSAQKYNLWNVHEFGAFVPGFVSLGKNGKKIAFSKEGADGPIVRQARKSYNISKYKGKIANDILPSLRYSIRNQALLLGSAILVERMVKVSGGKIKPSKAEFLAALELTESRLSAIGIRDIHFSETGQVNLRGAKGRFVSHQGTGIPSTINTSGSNASIRVR